MHRKLTAQSERLRQSGFALLILPTCFLIGALHFASYRQGDPAQEKVPEPLEIRLAKPPQWKDGCLSVNLDRTNHSPLPRFLPVKGLYIYSSVSEVGDDADKDPEHGWRNVYGLSDLGDWGATAIAPGTTVHDEFCLGSTIPVVSLERQTRREIPLRGRLKIDAYYFLTEEDWQKNKSQKEEMLRTPASQWRQTDFCTPRWSQFSRRSLVQKASVLRPATILHLSFTEKIGSFLMSSTFILIGRQGGKRSAMNWLAILRLALKRIPRLVDYVKVCRLPRH